MSIKRVGLKIELDGILGIRYKYAYCFLGDGFGVDVLGALVVGGGEAELVHHPVGLGALAGAAAVVHQRLLQPDALTRRRRRRVDGAVDPRRFPETGARHPIRPHAVLVLPPSPAEEVPFFLPHSVRLCNSIFPPKLDTRQYI